MDQEEHLTAQKLSMKLKGTTTIGVVCPDGVVMATDRRAVAGYFVAHKKTKKVFPIDGNLAMTIAGTVADCQTVLDVIRANAKLYQFDTGRPMPVSSAARYVANLLFSSRVAPLEMQAIIGGVDETGPHIFALDLFGTVTEEKCFSTGSGSPVALGVLEDGYRDGIKVEETVPLVVRAIDSAIKRNIGTGDGFDVAIITKDGYKELTEEEKSSFLSRRA